MTNPSNSQSQKRHQESLGALFFLPAGAKVHFLKSSTDWGVIRNGGRNGARFAPKALLSVFRKLTQDHQRGSFTFAESEVSSEDLEQSDFLKAQVVESEKIKAAIKESPGARIIHVGGGHDHIYPLLRSFAGAPRIIVLNVDAHADTRTDEIIHSGTPFRQFAREFKGEFFLYQVGLHRFANSLSTLSPLPRGEQKILWREDISQGLEGFMEELEKKISPDTLVIFSLDADAVSGDLVPGVSAVNGAGLSLEELHRCWDAYRKLCRYHAPILGIYELNPLYDTLSSVSMRTIANFIFRGLV